jgi:hypothetical protein
MAVLRYLAGVLNPTKKTVLKTKVSFNMKISLDKQFLSNVNEFESSNQLVYKGICDVFLTPSHRKLDGDNTSFFLLQPVASI